MVKIFYKDQEYENIEELMQERPAVYMESTKKIKDSDNKVIGREYYFEDYTENQINDLNAEKMKVKIETGRAECFSIINRGKLWYDKLTSTQAAELSVYYQEWLDIPDKPLEYIPAKPSWIK